MKRIDYEKRMNCAISLLEKPNENPDFIHNLIMKDEANFHINSFGNKQNSMISTENPRTVHQRQPTQVYCFGVVYRPKGSLAHIFFETEAGDADNAIQYQANAGKLLKTRGTESSTIVVPTRRSHRVYCRRNNGFVRRYVWGKSEYTL